VSPRDLALGDAAVMGFEDLEAERFRRPEPGSDAGEAMAEVAVALWAVVLGGLQMQGRRGLTNDCVLIPNMIVDLASPVSGVIASVKVDKGSTVTKGSVVVEMQSEVERTLVELNRVKLAFSQKTMERNRDLIDQNLISPQERDEIVLRADMQQRELVASQARLNEKQITSPIDGVVLERLMDPGEYVSELPMLKIASLDPLYVEAILPGTSFGTIVTGMQARVSLGEPLGGTYPAEVTIVDQVIDAASGTYGVRLVLNNADNQIPAGLKCGVSFDVGTAQ